jgi:hypothetical protein
MGEIEHILVWQQVLHSDTRKLVLYWPLEWGWAYAPYVIKIGSVACSPMRRGPYAPTPGVRTEHKAS